MVAWSRLRFRSYSRFLREPYTADAVGIEHANVELANRRAVHTAFAAQPDITPIWQGWIDLAARDVADQEAVVQHLTDRRPQSHRPGTESGSMSIPLLEEPWLEAARSPTPHSQLPHGQRSSGAATSTTAEVGVDPAHRLNDLRKPKAGGESHNIAPRPATVGAPIR